MRALAGIAVVVGLVVLAGCATLGTGSEEEVQTAQWTFYPGFQGLGLHLKRDIPLTYLGPAGIVVTASQDVDLVFTMTGAGSGGEQTQKGIAVFVDGKTWTADIDFPSYGVYQVDISGKLRSEPTPSYAALAHTLLSSEVNPGASVRFFPAFKAHNLTMAVTPAREAGDTATVSVSSAERLKFSGNLLDSSGSFVPDGAVSIQDSGENHTVVVSFPDSGAYTLIASARPETGTDEDWEGVLMASFSATTSPPSIPGAPANWKATPAVRAFGLAVTSSTGGNATEEADVRARASLTVAGKVYECSGPVLIEDFGDSESSVFAVRIATSRDYAFKVGKSSFTAPAGALVTFLREAVVMVIFPKDTNVTLNGASDTIPAGWGISFDADGNGTKGKVE